MIAVVGRSGFEDFQHSEGDRNEKRRVRSKRKSSTRSVRRNGVSTQRKKGYGPKKSVLGTTENENNDKAEYISSMRAVMGRTMTRVFLRNSVRTNVPDSGENKIDNSIQPPALKSCLKRSESKLQVLNSHKKNKKKIRSRMILICRTTQRQFLRYLRQF